jgi:hypothetical protein
MARPGGVGLRPCRISPPRPRVPVAVPLSRRLDLVVVVVVVLLLAVVCGPRRGPCGPPRVHIGLATIATSRGTWHWCGSGVAGCRHHHK